MYYAMLVVSIAVDNSVEFIVSPDPQMGYDHFM
jgi:hypothetical protein